MPDTPLDRVYGLETVEDTRELYDEWADTYDAQLESQGFATPGRVADALIRFTDDKAAPVLDFGCGTGLSGVPLHEAGFTTIDGCDLSAGMLDQARAKGIYRNLLLTPEDGSLEAPDAPYRNVIACGVISKGAAPPELFDPVMEIVAPGGHFAFSFNDHTFEDPRFMEKLDAITASGRAELLFREDGPHLPGIGLRSTVFVLRKAES